MPAIDHIIDIDLIRNSVRFRHVDSVVIVKAVAAI